MANPLVYIIKENYTVASRYEFYFLVVKNNVLLAVLVRKILFTPLENKIHIFTLPCNILYLSFRGYYLLPESYTFL